MVRLRMRREGKKGHPVYKVVAADKRSPRDGRFLEVVGQYDPNAEPSSFTVNEARVEYWLGKGAQASDTVRTLLRRSGFWLRWTLKRQGKDEKTIASVTERWTMQQADRQKRMSDKKARKAASRKKASAKQNEPSPAPAAE